MHGLEMLYLCPYTRSILCKSDLRIIHMITSEFEVQKYLLTVLHNILTKTRMSLKFIKDSSNIMLIYVFI